MGRGDRPLDDFWLPVAFFLGAIRTPPGDLSDETLWTGGLRLSRPRCGSVESGVLHADMPILWVVSLPCCGLVS